MFEDIVTRVAELQGKTLRLVELARAQFYEYSEERQEDLELLRRDLWSKEQPARIRALLKLCEAPRIFRKTKGAYRDGEGVGTCGIRERTAGHYQLSEWDRHLGIQKRIRLAKKLDATKAGAIPELVCSHAGYDRHVA